MSTVPTTERLDPEADLQIKMAEAADKTRLESWWIASASLWVSVIAVIWSAAETASRNIQGGLESDVIRQPCHLWQLQFYRPVTMNKETKVNLLFPYIVARYSGIFRFLLSSQ